MLEISFLRENKAKAVAGLEKKNYKTAEQDIATLISLDDSRRNVQVDLDNNLAKAKIFASEIGMLMKQGKQDEANKAKELVAELKETEKSLKEKVQAIETEILQLLYKLPNIPNDAVPAGKSEKDNIVRDEHNFEINLPENALPHWELIQKYDIIDFELGNKITGAGFPVYKGKGARIQRALINFFLDEAAKAGYKEVIPPILVNEASGYGTGQLPDKEGQMYHATADNLYLIPTAEVPITNIYRDVILKEEELPVKNVGYTPCFRREAGSWGAHVRGLNRLHQFDKVEIVQITKPENSYQALEEMLEHVKDLLKKLNLPFRTLTLCGGDISFTSALTYDLEVYSAAQKQWLEVSSVSNFETYQANRLKLRYKNQDKKSVLLHTLNGSALALPRILASILENNQTENGIKIPEVLVPYCGFEEIN
jgi:seryl-tRNA synthetase